MQKLQQLYQTIREMNTSFPGILIVSRYQDQFAPLAGVDNVRELG